MFTVRVWLRGQGPQPVQFVAFPTIYHALLLQKILSLNPAVAAADIIEEGQADLFTHEEHANGRDPEHQ